MTLFSCTESGRLRESRLYFLLFAGRSVREAGICSKRSNIYVTGGKPDDMAAHVFDVRFGQWSSLPEMIRPRRCHGNRLLHVT